MNLNVELWRKHQYYLLVRFVHHIAYYRVLHAIYVDIEKESEFWKWTIDAHLLRAVIDWCMVFGTDSNEIHWKKVVLNEDSHRDFREQLLKVSSLREDQWVAYWRDMTTFRNKFAAHTSARPTYPPVPMMDTALLVATTYDRWFRELLDADFDDPPLQERYERVTRTSERFLRDLVALGPTLEQEYEGRPPSSR